MTTDGNALTPEEWAQAEAGPVVAVDFGTFYTATYSVAELGHWAYTHDPRFHAYLVAVTDGERTRVCLPAKFPWASIAGKAWVSHNRDFDRAVFERLQEQGAIPRDVRPREWSCSAAACAYVQQPRDLASAAKAVLGVTIDKEIRTRARGWHPDEGSLFAAEVSRYAARDAETAFALWRHLDRYWPAHERRLFELTSEMGRRGVAVDWDYVRARRLELEQLVEDLSAALPWRPAASVKQFGEACERIGVPAPSSTSNGDPAFHRWLEEHIDSDAATWVRHMQRIRSANRTARVLEAMEARRMPSGRMAYELKYFGASTGRWSGGGGLNLQNLNRKTAEGVDLRRAIIAPPGHVLAVVDYSQIESRVLLYLAGDTAALEMFRADPEADAYEIHARSTMGYAEPEPLKNYCERTGSNLRQLAKARVLGLGYGCGWQKFVEVARVMAGLELAAEESRRIVTQFRNSNPLIIQLWDRLHRAAAAHDGRNYALAIPSTHGHKGPGRYLIYRKVRFDLGTIACTVGGRQTTIYGGLLAENWTQATARDVLATAWLRCVAEGFPPILSVHDELVFELPAATAQSDLARIKAIMETPVPWAPQLPLRVEGKLTPHYAK